MTGASTSRAWERYARLAGTVFVIALVAESVVATGVGLTQDDAAAKIASGLHEHRERLLVIAYLSVGASPPISRRRPGRLRAFP